MEGGLDSRPLDVAVIGGGLVGLATAYRLLERRPDLRLAVLEREPELAFHQSGHNSGVVHAGIYYPPGSLKARLCREGKEALESFCAAHGIPLQRVGKLIVALTDGEFPRLAELSDRGTANGVPGLEVVGPERLRELEPHAAGLRALWSPSTAVVDFRQVALALADDIRDRGASVQTGREVLGIERRPEAIVLSTTGGTVKARSVIACAGLWSDRVAALAGDLGPDAPRIVPFRGDYYTLDEGARRLVRGLIYPVPRPGFPFLGVHLTRRIDGEVWAGPNAVLAFSRTGYRRRDVSVRDLAATLTHPGFLRLASRFARTGLGELWRDVSKGAFFADVRRYVPELRIEQLRPGPSGVRAQAVRRDGTLLDDFDLATSGRILHVRNAPSPAATACLAIGATMAQRAIERFGL